LYKLIHLHAKLEDDDADEDGDDAVAVTPGGILSRKTSPRNPSLQRRLGAKGLHVAALPLGGMSPSQKFLKFQFCIHYIQIPFEKNG